MRFAKRRRIYHPLADEIVSLHIWSPKHLPRGTQHCSGHVHTAGGGSCFKSVFWACVRIVWKGFAANSGVARIIGMRMRSTCLQRPRRDMSLPHKQHEQERFGHSQCTSTLILRQWRALALSYLPRLGLDSFRLQSIGHSSFSIGVCGHRILYCYGDGILDSGDGRLYVAHAARNLLSGLALESAFVGL